MKFNLFKHATVMLAWGFSAALYPYISQIDGMWFSLLTMACTALFLVVLESLYQIRWKFDLTGTCPGCGACGLDGVQAEDD